MEKFKTLNEDLLDDEDHPELIDLCNKILKQLDETTAYYKKIAKKKGMKYVIEGKKTKKNGQPLDSTSSLIGATNRKGSVDGESEMNATLGATSSQNVDGKTTRTHGGRSSSHELISENKQAMKIQEGSGLVEIPSIRTQDRVHQITE